MAPPVLWHFPISHFNEFPYPPPELRPRHFLALRGSLEGNPAFRWVPETYRRHRGTSAAIAG